MKFPLQWYCYVAAVIVSFAYSTIHKIQPFYQPIKLLSNTMVDSPIAVAVGSFVVSTVFFVAVLVLCFNLFFALWFYCYREKSCCVIWCSSSTSNRLFLHLNCIPYLGNYGIRKFNKYLQTWKRLCKRKKK